MFEAGWQADEVLPRHRALIAPEHRGRGREVISWDWTLVHHERGPQIYGTTKSYDYVARRMGRFQTVVTAVIANRQLIDGIDLQIQEPSVCKEEEEKFPQADYAFDNGVLTLELTRLIESKGKHWVVVLQIWLS